MRPRADSSCSVGRGTDSIRHAWPACVALRRRPLGAAFSACSILRLHAPIIGRLRRRCRCCSCSPGVCIPGSATAAPSSSSSPLSCSPPVSAVSARGCWRPLSASSLGFCLWAAEALTQPACSKPSSSPLVGVGIAWFGEQLRRMRIRDLKHAADLQRARGASSLDPRHRARCHRRHRRERHDPSFNAAAERLFGYKARRVDRQECQHADAVSPIARSTIAIFAAILRPARSASSASTAS